MPEEVIETPEPLASGYVPYGSETNAGNKIELTVQSLVAFVLIGIVLIFLVTVVIASYIRTNSQYLRNDE